MNDNSQTSGHDGAVMVKNLSRKEREKQRNTQAILQAAEKVFADKGFNKTKMSDIAEVSEFSVGYLYNLWQGKDELYLDVLNSKIEEFFSSLTEQYHQSDNALEKINIMIDTHFLFFEMHRDFFRIYLSEISQIEMHCDNVFDERLWQKREHFFELAEEVFSQGVEQGVFVAHSPRDLAIALKGIMFAFSIESLNLSSPDELREKRNIVKEIFFNSILKNPETAGKELRAS
jgi:TetR/AcrR family transcriptional regulator